MPIVRRNSQGKTHVVSETSKGYTPENLFGSVKNETAKTGPYYSRLPEVQKLLNEHFDMSDKTTRQTLIAMDEASHNTVLTTLTSKLYDHIVKKTADIDFGEIPSTNGDITKLSQYEDLKEVIGIMKDMLKEYRQPTDPVDTLTVALANLETRKDLFKRAYAANCELPILMYNTTALSIINGISYLIAVCIEFIKSPKDESFQISLDKVAYAKTKDHLLYQTLDKFNRSCERGDFDKAMEAVIQQRVKKFTGVAIGVLAGTVAGIIVILNIIPVLREMVYLIYYSRMKVADFFEIQADLLQMNAYNVEHNSTIDKETRNEIAKKQTDIADRFRKISNAATIDAKKTDVETTRELHTSNKKLKIDELEDEVEEYSDSDNNSALF